MGLSLPMYTDNLKYNTHLLFDIDVLQVSAPPHVTPLHKLLHINFTGISAFFLSLPTTVAMHVSSSNELVPSVDIERSYDGTCVAINGYLTSELERHI